MANLSALKSLAGDSLIYGVSGVVSRFINVLLVPVYTRIFAPPDFGVISLITNFAALLNILIILGMDNSLARWYYDDETENEKKISLNTYFWSCLAISVFFAALLVIFRAFIAVRVLFEDATVAPLLIVALSLPLSVFINFSTNVLRIQRRARIASVFAVVVALLTVSLNILFVVVLKIGIIGVFYSQILTSFVAAVWTLVLFFRELDLKFFDFGRWKKMFAFSFPLIPGTIAFWVINFSGVYFIQLFQTSREVGLYQIGAAIATAMALLTQSFQMAWGPFAFSIYKEPDAKKTYADVFLLYLGITVSLAVLITLFSGELLMILTTKDYYAAFIVAGILAFNHLFIGLGYVASVGTNLAKNNKAYGIASVLSGFLLVGLNFILIPRFGIEGAATATLLSQMIIPLIVFIHAQKIYPVPYDFMKAALILISGFVAGFGMLYLTKYVSANLFSIILFKAFAAFLFIALVFYLLNLKSYLTTLLTKLSGKT